MSNIVKNHNGIFYFRYVIPQNEKHFFPNHKKEFRKSLKTRLKSEALNKAKFLWVKMKENIQKEYQDVFDQVENEDHKWRTDITRGLQLVHRYESLDNDIEGYDLFFDSMSKYDRECFILATDQNASLDSSNFTQNKTVNVKNDYLISELIDKFIIEKALSIKNQKTLDTYKSKCLLFLRIVNVNKFSELNDDKVRHFKETLFKLPKNINSDKTLKSKSIEQILKSNKGVPLSTTTIGNILTFIKPFLSWLTSNKYIDTNYSDILTGVIKKKTRSNESKAVFTVDDLQKMFSVIKYQTGFRKYPFRYWVPLIGLYSGARLSEICQLTISDVFIKEGVLVFSFNDEDDKSIKNLTSIRIVPVHKKLIDLGFNDYLAEVKRRGEKKLFPHLTPDKYGSYGRKVSRFFNDDYKGKNGFVEYCSIKKNTKKGKKVFHSFRHTFIDEWKQKRLDQQIIKEIVGHSQNDMTFDRYGKDFDIKTKQKELNKIKFDVVKPIKWSKRFY